MHGIELVLWIALMGLGSLVVLAVIEESDVHSKDTLVLVAPDDMIEAESLTVGAREGDFQFWLQPTAGFEGGRWSKEGHMMALRAQQGDWIELALPRLVSGLYRIELFLSRAPDYGIISFELNGAAVGSPVDLWSEGAVVPADPVSLGPVPLRDESNTLRITVVDTNAASVPPHYQFAIDGVSLRGAIDQSDEP
jgi:hypothetical protein